MTTTIKNRKDFYERNQKSINQFYDVCVYEIDGDWQKSSVFHRYFKTKWEAEKRFINEAKFRQKEFNFNYDSIDENLCDFEVHDYFDSKNKVWIYLWTHRFYD